MSGYYLHPVDGWTPIAVSGGGGGVIDVVDLTGYTGGILAYSPILQSLDDTLWGVLDIQWAPAPISGSGLFREMRSIATIPFAIPAIAGSAAYMFQACTSLRSIPTFDMSGVTNVSFMFTSCGSLVEIPALDFSSVTGFTSAFGTTTAATWLSALTSFKAFGATRGFTLRGTQMDAAALNELMSNLGTASGAQTIDIRNNPGSATCDTSIATAKGWTVLT